MGYDKLEKDYWQKQILRVGELLKKINERSTATKASVIPEEEDLVIGSGKRLPMAVMFLDISGFSARPAERTNEQESLLRALNLFFTEMVRIAEDYGGTVEKNTGDGLMAYFEDGGGSPPEDGTKRAVACALTMVQAGTSLINPIFRASYIEEIQFRIVIDHGNVTIARLGSPKRFNANVAIGTTANIASKMLIHAKPGDILLGDVAYKRLPSEWRLFWTQFLTLDTGWVYRLSSQLYPFYRYTGRWTGPM